MLAGLASFVMLVVLGMAILALEEGAGSQPKLSSNSQQKPSPRANSVATSPEESGGNEGTAFVMAQAFVKKTLKSPSSASFGSVFSGTFQDPEKVTKHLGGNRYRIRAWVESDNSFGATLRKNFSCTVKENDDGTWSCDSVSVDN